MRGRGWVVPRYTGLRGAEREVEAADCQARELDPAGRARLEDVRGAADVGSPEDRQRIGAPVGAVTVCQDGVLPLGRSGTTHANGMESAVLPSLGGGVSAELVQQPAPGGDVRGDRDGPPLFSAPQ